MFAKLADLTVERTFGWLGRSRRLSLGYERKTQVAEAVVYLAMRRASCFIAGANIEFPNRPWGAEPGK